jgi:hypothetical protein
MAKLTENQKEQCRLMYKDGKKAGEILEFFKNSYKIIIPSATLSYIIHGKPSTKRQYKKRQTSGQPIGGGTSTDNIKNLIDQLRAELEAYSKFVIGKIRIELVKAIGEARKKRIDVGEDAEEYKIETE